MPLSALVALCSPPYSQFSYSIPAAFGSDFFSPGMRVIAPLGEKSLRMGVIASLAETERDARLKDIFWPLDKTPLIPPDLLAMYADLALRQGLSLGLVMGHVLPAGLRQPECLVSRGDQLLDIAALRTLDKGAYERLCRDLVQGEATVLPPRANLAEAERCILAADPPWPVRPAATRQLAALDYLYQEGATSRKFLQLKTGASAETIKKLVAQKLIRMEIDEGVEEDAAPLLPPPEAAFALNEDQAEVLASLAGALDSGRPETRLLYGITGSGKTAVYLMLARKAIERGKSVLLLAPEVALAQKLLQDARTFLPDQNVFMHHGYQSPQKREKLFRRLAADERPCLVVGTRSSLFLPFFRPGCIIVDEEHDASYKQDETLPYNAKEIAWQRMREARGLLVLGSATPDIKSFYAARTGALPALNLGKRVSGLPLPPIELVKLGLKSGFDSSGKNALNLLSRECEEALLETVKKGEQAVVLLNRRGYAPLMYCLDCGKTLGCPDCGIGLAYHKARQKLVCHYCGKSSPHPSPCPECGGFNFLPLGEGTEKLAEHLGILVGRPILRLDRDNTRRPGKIEEILTNFARQKSPLLVGTQMLSKGHHFPNVTLAVVADGDLGLNLPDYRAAERTFQLLLQAAGRPGRGAKPGRVFIQTRDPSHYCWRYLVNNDYEGFYEEELDRRRKRAYPPFVRLALLRFSWPREYEEGLAAMNELGKDLRQCSSRLGIRLLGPTPSPLPMLRGKKRFQCLIKSDDWKSVRELANYAKTRPAAAKLRILLDLDPVSML